MRLSIFTPTHDPKYLLDTISGLCECGCGGKTTIPLKSNKGQGRVRGVPVRFIRGHQSKGTSVAEETKRKLSLRMKGNIPWNKGVKHSSETKEKIRIRALGRTPWNRGIPRTEECKQKISKNHTNVSGENNPNFGQGDKIRANKNPNWRNGISKEPYSFDFSKELKELIRKRDGYMCQLCWTTDNKKRKMPIHHIDYDKKNCDPNNLVTLCDTCHGKTIHKREYWKKYFNEVLLCPMM